MRTIPDPLVLVYGNGPGELGEIWVRESQARSVLEPLVYWIGNTPLLHGERAEEDLANPEACLCGYPDYMMCPKWSESGISSWEISK